MLAYADVAENGGLVAERCVPDANGKYAVIKSPAVNKLYAGTNYNVFSTVINNIAVPDYSTDFAARTYVNYTDASGIERYHYVTETGSKVCGYGYKANLKNVADYILTHNSSAVAQSEYLERYINAILNDEVIDDKTFPATNGPINGGNYP